ncbi:hypothetical protein [Pseudomonas sp. DSP3-2-2]|uniref:hypothetical protein n=1 Tax=unclassified Pseudomonas TaxID=196821 RepID=UPI003CF9E77A
MADFFNRIGRLLPVTTAAFGGFLPILDGGDDQQRSNSGGLPFRIQSAITERWQRDNPWTWQRKHFAWFLNHHLNQHTQSTRYYYLLTMQLLTHRLGKSWQFNL